MADIPQEELDAFYAELSARKITVSGIRFGKQELSPSTQIPEVDEMWREFFPGRGAVCPIFKHSGEDAANSDICRVDQIPADLTTSAVIIAGPSYDGKSLEAKYMVHDEMWNGVTHVKSEWDGKVSTALSHFMDQLNNYGDGYKESNTPQPDWIVVTVDYHC